MSFKNSIAGDIMDVFLNTDEFADEYTISFGGKTYRDVHAVLCGGQETARARSHADDHAQGLLKASHTMYCASDALGGLLPRQGAHIRLLDESGLESDFHILNSTCESGMLKIGLDAIE